MGDSVIFDWVRLGFAVTAFILIGKFIFVGYHVPILDKVFAAV